MVGMWDIRRLLTGVCAGQRGVEGGGRLSHQSILRHRKWAHFEGKMGHFRSLRRSEGVLGWPTRWVTLRLVRRGAEA